MKSINWLKGSNYLSKIKTFFFLLTNNFVFHIEKKVVLKYKDIFEICII